MRTLRLPLTLVLAVAALSAVAAPASAEPVRLVTYLATVSGEVQTEHTDRLAQPGGVLTTTGKGKAGFTAEIAGLRFRNGVPQVTEQQPTIAGIADIEATTSRIKEFDCGPDCPRMTGACSGGLAPDEASFLTTSPRLLEGGHRVLIEVGSFRIEQSCSGELFGFSDDIWLEGEGARVETQFVIPADRIGDDVITHRFRKDPEIRHCPNHTPQTIACSFDFSGTVTLRKTGDETRDEEPPTPPQPVPAGPAPAPAPGSPGSRPQTPVPAAPAGPVAPPRVTTGKLPPKLSAYEVAIRCRRVGCGGTVKAYPKPRLRRGGRPRARSSAAPKPLAVARFTSATDSARVRLRFDAADRAAIRRAGGLQLVVTTEGAPAVTRTVTLARR